MRRSGATCQPWFNGVVGALWAAVIGLGLAALPMLVMWMSSPQSGLTWIESLRLAGLLWVAAHGVPATIAGVTVTLVPWGLVIIPLLLLGYAGGGPPDAAMSTPRGLRRTSSSPVPSPTPPSPVCSLCSPWAPSASVSAVAAIGYAFVVAVLALGFGTWRASAFSPARVRARPGCSWSCAHLAVGAAALLGFGAVAATVSLTAHIDDAVTMAQSLAGGIGGGLGLLALGAAYVPVMAMWGAAYVMGAGVVIGPAVTMSPFVAVTAPAQSRPSRCSPPCRRGPLRWPGPCP